MASFFVTDDEIFLFYDSSGIVNTYSLDGEFQYGIQFATSTHGTGDISYFNGILLIKSRRSVIFEFDDKNLVQAYSYSENNDNFKWVELYMKERGKNHTVESENYYYWESTNQILKEDEDGELSVVIELPQKIEFVYLLGLMIILTLIGFCEFYSVARVWSVKKNKN